MVALQNIKMVKRKHSETNRKLKRKDKISYSEGGTGEMDGNKGTENQ
jgi:hypothetical protein